MDLTFIQTPIASIILAIVTVFSLLFAVYSHRRNASNQKLGYRIQGKPLFSKSKFSEFLDPDLSLHGTKADSLYAMRIQILNRGTLAVEPKDLAPNGVITVKCLGSQLRETGAHRISAGIAEVDNPSGRFELDIPDPTEESLPEIILRFDFIPPHSGVVIDAITTVPYGSFVIDDTTKSFGPIRNLNKLGFKAIVEIVLFILLLLGVLSILFYTSITLGDFVPKRFGFVAYEGFGMVISFGVAILSMITLGALIVIILTKTPKYFMMKSTYYWITKGLSS